MSADVDTWENEPSRYGVEIPGAHRRQRHDRRRTTPKPKEPLVFYFTTAELRILASRVRAALRRAEPARRHAPYNPNACLICKPARCVRAR